VEARRADGDDRGAGEEALTPLWRGGLPPRWGGVLRPRPTFVLVAAVVVASHAVPISYEQAKPSLAAYPDQRPAALRGKSDSAVAAAWPAWVASHNAAIRARLARGDEDSLVNFWLYGTTFTKAPRATAQDVARLGSRDKIAELLERRLSDLIAGIESPGSNERLQFARRVVERHGIKTGTAQGRERTRAYLLTLRERVIAETERYRKTLEAATLLTDERAKLSAYATAYRDRGLSSDTSIAADFALDAAIADAKSSGVISRVRRVAIVGPGLDFSDKAEGYDFYPVQTIQPFALIDSLVRHGAADARDLSVATLDLSPRVNQHLDAARTRARGGTSYVVQLPLSENDPSRQWAPALVAYWERFGDRIGEDAIPIPPPDGAGKVRVRAVRIPAAVVDAIEPYDVNIVLERLTEAQFDLVVATNILVYYDAFEQSLALANVAAMLRPGGLFLTNYAMSPLPPMEPKAAAVLPVFWDDQKNGDTLFWYRRN